MRKEILNVSKISSGNKVYIPKGIRERFNFKTGDKIVWSVNEDQELILSNPKEKQKKEEKNRFSSL